MPKTIDFSPPESSIFVWWTSNEQVISTSYQTNFLSRNAILITTKVWILCAQTTLPSVIINKFINFKAFLIYVCQQLCLGFLQLILLLLATYNPLEGIYHDFHLYCWHINQRTTLSQLNVPRLRLPRVLFTRRLLLQLIMNYNELKTMRITFKRSSKSNLLI